MKRIVTILILPLLLLSLAAPVGATAHGTAAITADTYAYAGKTVTVTVTIREADLLQAAMLLPEYDRNVFELVDFAFLQEGVMSDFNGEDGVILWETPTDPNGAIATFSLKVKDNAAPGNYTVGCRVTVRDENDELQTLDTEAAVVTVRSYILGDVNGDGTINPLDALMVLQCYVGAIEADSIHPAAADVSGDGMINPLDALMVLQYYVGVIHQFPADH